MCSSVYVGMYVCTDVCMYICVYVCMYVVCMYVLKHVCVHVHIYVMYVCMCMYIRMYLCMYVCMYYEAGTAQSVQRLATGWTVRGSNPGRGRDFLHPSIPAVGPTQAPIQRVPGLSRGKTVGAWR